MFLLSESADGFLPFIHMLGPDYVPDLHCLFFSLYFEQVVTSLGKKVQNLDEVYYTSQCLETN